MSRPANDRPTVRAVALGACTIALAACGGDARVVITDLAAAGQDLDVLVTINRTGLVASVGVGGADCTALGPTFGGTIAGAPAPAVYAGADVGADFSCMPPTLTFATWPAQAPATLEISDDTRVLTVELGDALMPRAATLVAPGSGIVAPGTELIFAWTPATDVTRDPTLTQFTVFEHSFVSGEMEFASIAARDGQVVAVAPDTPKIPGGGGELTIMFRAPTAVQRLPLTCATASCKIDATHFTSVPVVFSN